MEVVRNGVGVDLGDRAFLGTHATGEVTEVIDREWDIRRHRFAQRLAVVDRLGDGQPLQVCFHPVGNAVQDVGAIGCRGFAPRRFGAMRGVEREFDIGLARTRNRRERFTSDGGDVVEILAANRLDPFTANKIRILLFVREFGGQKLHLSVIHLSAPHMFEW
jgi:hypothetical protein